MGGAAGPVANDLICHSWEENLTGLEYQCESCQHNIGCRTTHLGGRRVTNQVICLMLALKNWNYGSKVLIVFKAMKNCVMFWSPAWSAVELDLESGFVCPFVHWPCLFRRENCGSSGLLLDHPLALLRFGYVLIVRKMVWFHGKILQLLPKIWSKIPLFPLSFLWEWPGEYIHTLLWVKNFIWCQLSISKLKTHFFFRLIENS